MPSTARRIRHLAEYAAGRAALALINLLPERPAYAVVGALGRLYFRCSRRRQRYALDSLHLAFPDRGDAELLHLARTATGNVFKVILDTVRVIPLIRSGRLAEHIDMSELAAIYTGPPSVMITGHLGSWEIAGIAMAARYGEAHAIARVFKNPLLQRFILANRQAAGLRIHPKRGGIRALARALRQGRICMQVADQHQRLRGVMVPFFGRLASTERSAAAMALREGCPIFVGAAIRVGGGFRFRVVMTPPLHPVATAEREADVAGIAAAVNQRLEQLILAHPEQYLWIHNRYRAAAAEVVDEQPA